MKRPVIEVLNVFFSYPKKPVLENIELVVNSGDFIGVIGPNGSGKSTLIKLIAGLLKPDRGVIRLLGQEVSEFKEWHRVGYLSQKASAFNPSFPATVQEVVQNHLIVQSRLTGKLTKNQVKDRVERALAMTDLTGLRHRLVGELSGGQQQRVFLARVIANLPEVLLLDEPLVGVDPHSQELFCSALQYFNRQLGVTILMVTHNPEPIADLINRLACLEERRLFIHDDPEEIRHELQPHRHLRGGGIGVST